MRIKIVRNQISEYVNLDGKLLKPLTPFPAVSLLKTLLINHRPTLARSDAPSESFSTTQHSKNQNWLIRWSKCLTQSCSFALSKAVAQTFFFLGKPTFHSLSVNL